MSVNTFNAAEQREQAVTSVKGEASGMSKRDNQNDAPTAAPLSSERLAQVRALLQDIEQARERLTGVMGPSDRPRAPVLIAAHDLLAEVERRRAREAALMAEREQAMAVVRAVADAGVDVNYGYDNSLFILCPGDDAEAIRDKARALLAGDGSVTEGTAGAESNDA